MNKKKLLLEGSMNTVSGYSYRARDIAKSLIELDEYDIQIVNRPWGLTPFYDLDENNPSEKAIMDRLVTGAINEQPDVHIQITVPSEFRPLGKYSIGMTAGIETNLASPEWMEGLNKMNMVIVSSNHSKSVFDNTSYEKHDNVTKQKVGELKAQVPIEVLFEGYDESIFKIVKDDNLDSEVKDYLDSIPEDFAFLVCGHWMKGNIGQDRKDIGMTIKCFFDAFKGMNNPPALVMKTSGGAFSEIDRQDIVKKINTIKESYKEKLPNVYLVYGELSNDQMNSLYNHPKIKSMVTLTKGEGFGRPLLEFASIGKPIIATGWSGHVDFLDKNDHMLLAGELTDVDKSAIWKGVINEGSKWFTANYQLASNVMFDMFKNYSKYVNGAKKGRDRVSREFTMRHMKNRLKHLLGKHVISEEVLQLPKLKKK